MRESVPRPKKIPICAVKFEAGEKNRIVYENLYSADYGLDARIHKQNVPNVHK